MLRLQVEGAAMKKHRCDSRKPTPGIQNREDTGLKDRSSRTAGATPGSPTGGSGLGALPSGRTGPGGKLRKSGAGWW
jgi:hypothetical protein